ncbi:MAG: glycoside hydrolase/phage tail family protein [Rhodobacteraceae bacterium]|nr:glycoside hydrolase/phage tail family protein [Paracoccaceae bacterium]
MASILLASAGAAIGGSIGGAVLGVSAVTIGGAIGSFAGSMVDSWIVSSLAPGQRIEGQRLENLQITTSTEGAVIPLVYGRMRIGGNIIWATEFTETVNTTTQGGGKGGGPTITTTAYLYSASFAVALCEGPISGIGRIWADGKPLDLSGVTWRLYTGDEAQQPDPFIEAKMGAGNAPAYHGTAYVMFEELLLEQFGNRIPQLSFEVFRPIVEPDTAEGMLRAITLIPGTGEFVYATEPISRGAHSLGGTSGNTASENVHNANAVPDIIASLDQLQAAAPNIESISLVVSWFGTDLRAGNCQIVPGVENTTKITTPKSWTVNGVTRTGAHVISLDADGRTAYGGTPTDFAVVQAIKEIKARGLRVTFYPFLLMDIPAGNALPDPYSDNATTIGQNTYPWRGRITCSPATDYAGTVDKTAGATTQVDTFMGNAQVEYFSVSGENVVWTGPASDRGYRRMILHYAHLCAAAGGVETFLIGSELRGLTTIRDNATIANGAANYPVVAAMKQLAGDVAGILGSGTAISYAADWSEYFGHHPQDGSGDVFYHLDPLWSDQNIHFIGIDNYMPLSDWRNGFNHADAQAGWASIRDLDYLQNNIEGGEGFDWFYASDTGRVAQMRIPITDGAYGKPWVFRPKDTRSWWSNLHFDRPSGIESATSTDWTPQSKPIRFTELGCPAVDRGTNQPNVFYDPKSAESALPHFSRGWQDEAIQRRYIEAMLGYWGDPVKNPVSTVYAAPMIDMGEAALWTWDARPYPDFPAREAVWADAPNWRLGHWLNGRLGAVGLGTLVRELCRRAGLEDSLIDVGELSDTVPGFIISALESPRASISTLARHFGFDAVESGGVIRFVTRGQKAVSVISPDDMVAAQADVMELTRGQETELPQALKWQMVRPDEEYDIATVEARRITVEASRVASDSFPLAVSLEEADRRCRRALMEGWIGRETLTTNLPPSRLALDPGDVVSLANDGRLIDYRITRIGDAGARSIEAIRTDAAIYDLPPGQYRPAKLPDTIVYGPAEVALMDLPQISDAVPAHRPYAAVFAIPWYGTAAVWRSASDSGFALLDTVGQPAHMGVLATDLPAGPLNRFDNGNELLVDLSSGTLTSITDLELFAGANALGIESASGVWEILQAGNAELVSMGRYRLTRLLRGQRGTDDAMGDPAPAGARVVMLDSAIQPLSTSEADLGLPWNWRIGPASAPPSDPLMSAQKFSPDGRGLKPFAPTQLRMRREANGDLALRWLRRDRALAADGWVLTDVPMSEVSETYDLETMSGSSSLRTITGLAGPAFIYTAAMQVADFGGPITNLSIRLYQIGALGRGVPLLGTLSIKETL